MGAGDRRHRITLETPTEVRTGTGASKNTWATLATAWAEIDWADGMEQIQAGQVNARQPVKFTIEASRDRAADYLSGLTAKQRIVYRGRYFEVMSVAPLDGRNRKLVLSCMERVP